jgi:transposase-like protein
MTRAPKRKVGRPRTRPLNKAAVYLHAEEIAAIAAAAKRAGITAEEWRRQAIVAALDRAG